MSVERVGEGTDEPGRAARGVPLMPNGARQIIAHLFEERPEWSRKELSEVVPRMHRERGGLDGQMEPAQIVKRALAYLQEDGVIEQTGAKGYWRRRGTPQAGSRLPESGSEECCAADGEAEEAEEEEARGVRTIGDGSEWVYVYYNRNDRELAELKGEAIWECKVGSTTQTPTARALEQGARTALSHPPVFGLLIRTPDCAALEKALHISLRLTESKVPDSPGDEWFVTSPERVEAWYAAHQEALTALKGGPGQ